MIIIPVVRETPYELASALNDIEQSHLVKATQTHNSSWTDHDGIVHQEWTAFVYAVGERPKEDSRMKLAGKPGDIIETGAPY